MGRDGNGAMRICSWNVNGLRAAARHGFGRWLDQSGAEVVAVQEARARAEQVPESLRAGGWHLEIESAERPGYSGVALFSKRPPDRVETLGEARFDREGRVQMAYFGRLVVVNGYFPNGNGRNRDNSRIPYKLAFYRVLFDRLQRLRRGGRRVLVMGDFNTAHEPLDLARPKANVKTSGFRPEERAELSRWLSCGWIDTFRAQTKEPGHYTWWSQRVGVRERNVGWRIDYVLASKAAHRFVQRAFIQPEVRGSDHCPIGVDVDPAICD